MKSTWKNKLNPRNPGMAEAYLFFTFGRRCSPEKNKNNGAETKHGEDKQKKEGTSDTHDFKSLGEIEEVNDDDEAWRENEKQRGL